MKLIIFNLNCWLLPLPLSHNQRRLERIVTLIHKINPDIICLQEVWLTAYARTLQKEFGNYIFTFTKGTIFNESGLVTAVKKGTFTAIHTFAATPEYSLIEKLGRKGYHSLELVSNITLMNTHLYADTKPSEKRITNSQFELISEQIGNQNGILVGDFNIEEPDFLNVNKMFTYTQSHIPTLSKSNIYANWGFNQTLEDKTLDYIVATKRSRLDIKTEVLHTDVSDHFPIIGTVFL